MFIIEGLESRRLLALAGLVAGYGFDEGAGSTTADASGAGLGGSIQNASWVAGRFGNALSFNGTNAWVTVNDAPGLRLTTGMTLEAWVRPTTVSGWRTIVVKQRGTGGSYALFASDPNRSPQGPAGFINIGSDRDAWGTSVLSLNTWTHLTTTYDGTSLRMYVNGTLARTVSAPGTIATTADVLRIGGSSNGGNYFSGLIDEVRVYNRALSASEIQTDMNSAVNSAPTVDTTPPTVAITAPANNAGVRNTVTLTATASDNVAVAGVQFLVDGAASGAEDTTAPYSIAWNTTGLSGAHTVSAIARDSSGNRTTSSLVNVNVDTLAPTVAISSPAPGSTVSGTIGVTASASDNVAVAGVQFFRDGVSLGAEDTVAPYSISWNTTGLTGAQSITAVARDSAGNTSTSTTVSVTVDNVDRIAPTVSITAPAANASVTGSVTIAASASDNVGVVGVRFQLDGANLGSEDTTAPYSVNWNTNPVSNGNHTLTAIARDAAGNTTTSTIIPVRVANGVVTLSLNPSQRFQTMDGLGMNLNATAWNNGAVVPQLDNAINNLGASLFRVIIESVAGWEDTNDNADPFVANQTYYNQLYSTTKFTDLWNTIAYLNEHNQPVLLNVMGFLPTWLGGAGTIPVNLEDEYVEMITSMVDYCVKTRGLEIDYFSPMNEQDWGHNEGPIEDTAAYVRIVNKVINRFTTLGLTSIEIVGGETAVNTVNYADALLADSNAMQHITHFAFHDYTGSVGQFLGFDADAASHGFPGRNFWVTEYAGAIPAAGQPAPDDWTFSKQSVQFLHNFLSGGASATAFYDGIDAYYQHHFEVNTDSLIGWNQTQNTYFNRKQFYADGQYIKFIRPGMTRIGSTLSGNANVFQDAFYNAATGQLAVVGQNTGNNAVTFDINIGSLPISSLALYQTSSAMNMARLADVTVSGGIATVTIPADTIFTLSTPTTVDVEAPTAPSNLVATDGYGRVTLGWGASTDDTGVAGYDIHRSTISGFLPTSQTRVGQTGPSTTSFIDTVAAGTYYYLIVARDAAGNQSEPSNQITGNSLVDSTPPTVSLTAPSSGAMLSGTVNLTANAGDDLGLEGVSFYIDGNLIGTQDTTAPYGVSWTTSSVSNGTHTLTAVARDQSGNQTTSSPVQVNVQNSAVVAGLVAAWGFDEGAGFTASDRTGNGNAGTIANAVWTTGRFGNALRFNGTNALVTVANSAGLRLTTGMTLEAWVNPTTVSGWRTILMKQRGTGGSYAMFASDPNRSPQGPAGFIYTGSDRDSWGTSLLSLNTWTHLASTFDGTSLRMYVNGVLARTVSAPGAIATTADMLGIGAAPGGGNYFSGMIDEVRIYSRALSMTEIQTDMNSAINPVTPLAASLPAGPVLTSIQMLPAPTSVVRSIFTADESILT